MNGARDSNFIMKASFLGFGLGAALPLFAACFSGFQRVYCVLRLVRRCLTCVTEKDCCLSIIEHHIIMYTDRNVMVYM